MPLLNGVHWYPDASQPSGDQSQNLKVYKMRQTGEVFHTYEEYLQRLRLLHARQWSSQISGRKGLNYEEAAHEDKSVDALIAKARL